MEGVSSHPFKTTTVKWSSKIPFVATMKKKIFLHFDLSCFRLHDFNNRTEKPSPCYCDSGIVPSPNEIS